jgi:hypothetical protein
VAKGLQIEQFLAGWTDNSGQPLNGGKVYSYLAGTNTPQSLYTDKDCLSTSTNPTTLDSNGRAQVYADSSLSYKFIIKTSADATLYTLDNLFYPREVFLNSTVSGLELYNDTSDGSDSERLLANGGGASGVGRGAEIQLHGNESAGSGGRAILQTGNASGAYLDLINNSANGDTRFWSNAAVKWLIQGTNFHLLPATTNVYDVGSSSAMLRNLFATTVGSSGARADVYADAVDANSITVPYTNWTPNSASYTFSDGGGTMTWASGPTFSSSSYLQFGKFTLFWHYFAGTFGGTAQLSINLPPPVTAATIVDGGLFGWYDIAGTGSYVGLPAFTTTSNIKFRRDGGTAWPIGSAISVRLAGFYVAA